MDVERFQAARDSMYLAAVLIGFALGCVAVICDPRSAARRRQGMITAGLCFLSAAVAAFMAALIHAGTPLALKPLIRPFCAAALVSALAFRFPRAAAFPLALLGGLLAVWLGYSFLRFPRIAPAALPLASVYAGKTGDKYVYTIYIPGYGTMVKAKGAGKPALPPLEDNGLPVEISAGCIRFGELLPLIGGTSRGGLCSIRRGEESLAAGLALGSPPLAAYYARLAGRFTAAGPWGLSFRRSEARLVLEDIPPGLARTVSAGETAGEFTLRSH